MSDAPTVDQISDLRIDIGDVDTPQAFSDAEISRFWYRVRSARTEQLQYDATLALMARSLMTLAAKKMDYSTGNTSEKMSQLFEHLKSIFEMHRKALERVLGDNTDIVIGHLTGVTESEQPVDGSTYLNNGVWTGDPYA